MPAVNEESYQSKNIIRPEGTRPAQPKKNPSVPMDPQSPFARKPLIPGKSATILPFVNEPLAKPEDKPLPKPAAPADWTPINVRTGIFRNKELFATTKASFIRHERNDLKDVLAGGKNFGVRDALAKKLAAKRGRGGLTRKEVKTAVADTKKEFGLSNFKARQLRHKFGSYK